MKFLPLVLVTMLFSCTQDSNNIATRNVREVLKDSIMLSDVHADAELSYGRNSQGHLTINYYSRKKDKIYTYSTHTRTVSSIGIEPDSTRREFYMSGDGTAYILDDSKIALLKDGGYKNIYSAQNDTLPFTLYSLSMPFRVINNHVLLQKFPAYDIRTAAGRLAMFSSEVLQLYRIEGDSLQAVVALGRFPEEYKTIFHYEFSPKTAYNAKSQKVYYLFDNSDTIYECDIKKQKVQPHVIEGLALNNQYTFDTTKLADITYAQQYLLENSQYYMMMYDEAQDRLIVIQKSAIATTNKQGEPNTHEDQPMLIYCINGDYKVERIFKFESSKYHKFPFSYCHGGMLYVPSRDTRLKDGSRTLTVYVYGIE